LRDDPYPRAKFRNQEVLMAPLCRGKPTLWKGG
jgi:hypothetical protein